MAVCCKDVVSTQDETFIRMTELEHTHTHTQTNIHTLGISVPHGRSETKSALTFATRGCRCAGVFALVKVAKLCGCVFGGGGVDPLSFFFPLFVVCVVPRVTVDTILNRWLGGENKNKSSLRLRAGLTTSRDSTCPTEETAKDSTYDTI